MRATQIFKRMTSPLPVFGKSVPVTFNKGVALERVHKALDALTTFFKSGTTFANSHLTDFYTEDLWEANIPPGLRKDLESRSVGDVENCLRDIVMWKRYGNEIEDMRCSEFQVPSFEKMEKLEDLAVGIGRLKLSELGMSTPVGEVRVNGVRIYEAHSSPEDNSLKLDAIMSAKKMHEVEVMSDFIKNISDVVFLSSGNGNGAEEHENERENPRYLVDVGSGKGYLSSYLTLLHKFKVLAVDSSSTNSHGCEKRSARLEKVWAQLVRRAVERKIYGKCSKRGKNWKSCKGSLEHEPNTDNGKEKSSEFHGGESRIKGNVFDTETEEGQGMANKSMRSTTSRNADGNKDNKLLKTLTQFVTPNFDLLRALRENFPLFTTATKDADADAIQHFGMIGLHTCGNLGVASLRLFITNENAQFICNVPCCYHLLDENHLFYPSRKLQGSKSVERERSGSCKISNEMANCILDPTFPICQRLDVDSPNRFCLGRNARMMSAYSLPRMVSSEKGLELHPSIFYRSVLQVLIKKALGEDYHTIHGFEHYVGKIGDKCKTFPDYVRMGLRNLQLESRIQVTDDEINHLLTLYVPLRDNLVKFYLIRSLFASIVESIVLLDRLAYLLEQESVSEAHLVELFDPSVSPRCHAIIALKL